MAFSPACLPPTTAGGRRQRHLWHQGRAGALLLPQVNGGRAAAAPPHQVRPAGPCLWTAYSTTLAACALPLRLSACQTCHPPTLTCPPRSLPACVQQGAGACRPAGCHAREPPQAAVLCGGALLLLLLLNVASAAAKVALPGSWVQLLCCECTSGYSCRCLVPVGILQPLNSCRLTPRACPAGGRRPHGRGGGCRAARSGEGGCGPQVPQCGGERQACVRMGSATD